MRILFMNVPHPSIGSRIPDDHLPPLGLLSIGGPPIDDGPNVAEFWGAAQDAEEASMTVRATATGAST